MACMPFCLATKRKKEKKRNLRILAPDLHLDYYVVNKKFVVRRSGIDIIMKFAQACDDWQKGLETEAGPRADLISSGQSGAHQTTEVLGQETSVKFFFMLSCKVVNCREARRCPTQLRFT
ncbi:hypothetical protein M9H77_26918 [Catharanthus roseus]|uniref:Uncharacterized protein n=1 Tax=Catharanthus roseus TaxID=4058 RepID=A0ACC0ACL0_CATRO|nr:hypothetical protein M9H77_26918 [Catharanthus roseus]